jgi:hypothetical protein
VESGPNQRTDAATEGKAWKNGGQRRGLSCFQLAHPVPLRRTHVFR